MNTQEREVSDLRHIRNGIEIPTESYSDQPYIVQTADEAWLCCVTTGPGHEGASGQHVATLRSIDKGKTWSAPVPVEGVDSPENSYAVMLRVPSGRIYIFYNHNTDNVREVLSHDGQNKIQRVDSLGHFVFRYSDDHGQSWSKERYDIPFRLFQCDRNNVYEGSLCFFWNVGKPFLLRHCAYVPLIKVGEMGRGFFQQSEGVLLMSDNLLTEPDPARIHWITLPDGETGLRTPPGGGPVSEEQSYVVLSDETIYSVYRSIDGHPVESYSRDGGHTWTQPRYKCFSDGRRMKHPRAANFVWKNALGRYLYWFHNHGGAVQRETPGNADGIAYDDRNPAWLSAGLEIDTPGGREIAWSEPEIILYDDDPFIRMSYPDLIEADGVTYLTETQKDIARVHELPATLLEEMWTALAITLGEVAPQKIAFRDELRLLQLPAAGERMPAAVPLPNLPCFRIRDWRSLDFRGKDTREGIALELELTLPDLEPGRLLLDNRKAGGSGFSLATRAGGALELLLSDGRTENHWASDPVLIPGKRHHIVVNIDGGPRIISYVIDGRFCDGGDARQFGWGRFSPSLQHVNGTSLLTIGREVLKLSLYGRVLTTSEAVIRRHLLKNDAGSSPGLS